MDPFITIDGPQLAMPMVADTQPYIQTSEHMDVDTLAPSHPVLVAQPSASSLCATGVSDVSLFSSFASSGVQSHPTQDSAFARFLPDDGILYDRHGNPVSRIIPFTRSRHTPSPPYVITSRRHSRTRGVSRGRSRVRTRSSRSRSPRRRAVEESVSIKLYPSPWTSSRNHEQSHIGMDVPFSLAARSASSNRGDAGASGASYDFVLVNQGRPTAVSATALTGSIRSQRPSRPKRARTEIVMG
jgi:hypothetical protein